MASGYSLFTAPQSPILNILIPNINSCIFVILCCSVLNKYYVCSIPDPYNFICTLIKFWISEPFLRNSGYIISLYVFVRNCLKDTWNGGNFESFSILVVSRLHYSSKDIFVGSRKLVEASFSFTVDLLYLLIFHWSYSTLNMCGLIRAMQIFLANYND